ncbi:MAG: 3-hydroxyacyl-CoA dehydrogenase/enoyl-CoA hydratase/3-hydroxybutyryl-CoA epimerase, partial [Planctomycetota bacterium]
MIDLSGLPMPENAPDPRSCVRIERLDCGLVRLVLDPPHRKHTVLDLPLIRDLDLALDDLESGGPMLGVVITGRDPLHFAFGADIDMIESAVDVALVERAIKSVHAVFERIERLSCMTVAAVGGVVPGGAYELCLSCNVIVLADDPGSKVGLPETKLGILPAWGGTHRLAKRIGPAAALPLILQGSLLPGKVALRKGMVDRLTQADALLRVAGEIALGRQKIRRKPQRLRRLLVDRNPLAMKLVARMASKQANARTFGNYPAVNEVIELVTTAAGVSTREAAKREAHAGARLATGSVCKSLISIFRASEAAKKLGQGADGQHLDKIEGGTVIGAGVMGAGIAGLFAERGLTVRLSDLDQDGLDRALFEHEKSIERKVKRRRLARHEGDGALDRLTGTVDLTGVGPSKIVIEAIAERLDVKREVFGNVTGLVADDCILATNTSSLSVTEIARGLDHPERVLGMHFFNPVAKMPLVEIIPHEGIEGEGSATDPAAVARVAALALRCGKTPVVVRDVAGFLVNRILGPYLDEALRLAASGVNVARIDRLLLKFGMPMGPFRLLDEVGFDIAAHAAQSLHKAYGARMTPTDVL